MKMLHANMSASQTSACTLGWSGGLGLLLLLKPNSDMTFAGRQIRGVRRTQTEHQLRLYEVSSDQRAHSYENTARPLTPTLLAHAVRIRCLLIYLLLY